MIRPYAEESDCLPVGSHIVLGTRPNLILAHYVSPDKGGSFDSDQSTEDGNKSIEITLSARRPKCHGLKLECHIHLGLP